MSYINISDILKIVHYKQLKYYIYTITKSIFRKLSVLLRNVLYTKFMHEMCIKIFSLLHVIARNYNINLTHIV